MTRKLLPPALILAFCCLTPGWAEKQAPTRMAGTKTEAGAPGMPKASREPLELAYIANSGVMLSAGGTKILIDALFDKPHADYRSPDPETLEKIMTGDAPSKIDMVRQHYKDIFLLRPGMPVKTFREGRE